MSFTACAVATNNIAALDNLPNDVGGLTPTQLKALFDKFGADFVAWFNATHIAEADAHLIDYTLQVPYGGATTNVGNAYSIATPAIAALAAGMAISVKINADSTDVSTLNWNDKGAKAIKRASGDDVTNLKNGGIYTLRYDGTNFIVQGEGGSGDAAASDLLLGKTASTDAGDITGTLALTGDAIAANVLAGKTFYKDDAKTKLTGTGAIGKNYASGTGTPSGSYTYYFSESNTTGSALTVSQAFGFTPSIVIITIAGFPYLVWKDSVFTCPWQYYGGSFDASANAYVNANGFKLPCGGTSQVAWLAIE